MMIAIADSGSTKTSWAIFDGYEYLRKVETPGMNPWFCSPADMKNLLEKELLPYLAPQTIHRLYFYGAGCASSEAAARVYTALSDFFTEAAVYIQTDLQGALLASHCTRTAIAFILGTGANACVFQQDKVIHSAPSLGYLLGDEGSGAYLGKQIMAAYLNGQMPLELSHKLTESFRLTRESILEHIYRKPFPNRYLASFCPWLSTERSHPWAKEVLEQNFNAFFTQYISVLPDYQSIPLFGFGSIAHVFSDSLSSLLHQKGIQTLQIQADPLEGLIQYHLPEAKNG